MAGGSLPETSLQKITKELNQNYNISKMSKKFSQVGFKYDQDRIKTKLKNGVDASPKLKAKKQSMTKLSKVMSEQKKINYNIDVKLNINLKIN